MVFSIVAVFAYFAYTDSSNTHTAAAQGGSVGAGQTPAGFTVSGRDVSFSWGAANNALTYTVSRTNVTPGGLPSIVHGTCTGGFSATSCTDTGLPENGTTATAWTYTDTPLRYNWQGAASAAGAQVNVPGPTLSLTTTSFTAAGGSTNGTVNSFFDSESITYCIDTSSTPCGANQLGTDTVPASGGNRTTAVSIPAGESPGSHTVYAIGASGSAPSGVSITITGGTPTKVVFTTQPGGGANATAWSQQPVVAVEDSAGNVVTSSSAQITLAIASQPGTGATLSCTANPQNASSGVASFAGCQIVGRTGSYTITASSGGLTSATSNAFSITTGAAAQLLFTQQPSNSTGGVAFPTQPKVTIEDSGGNVKTADTSTVTLSIGTNPGSGTLSGCSETTTGGVATFSGCKIDRAGNGYTLTAADATDGLTTASAPSNAFNVTVGGAAKVGFAQQPSNTHSSSTISPAVAVQIQDAGGNLVSSSTASVTVAIGTNPGGGTLSGTKTVAASGGVATFSTLSINNTATGYTLTAASSGLTGATSSAFTIFGDATQLAFTTQPSGSTGGVAFPTQPAVAFEDAGGNIVGTETRTVALTILNNPSGGTLSGTTSLSAVNGIASFSDLSINKAGTAYTLQAACCSLTKGNSSPFNITVGPAAQLVFSQQPSDTAAGVAISPAVTVQIQDAGGNLISSSGVSVTMSVGTNPGGGTLSGTTTVTASGGVATFGTLSINKSGTGYTLAASSSGLPAATSSTFNITAATASKLAFTTQPSGSTGGIAFTSQPVVKVQDQFGNTVTGNSSSVTLAISSGTGTSGAALTCTTNPLAASSGVASFAGCKIDKAGSGYTLTATDGALTSAISSAFDVSVGPATKLVYGQQPTSATAGVAISPAVTVQVQDAGGNLVSSSTASITVAIGTNPGGGTLSGTTTVAAAGGVATFGDLSINKSGNGYTLTASSSGLTGATSSAFNITAAAASKLAFTTQPGSSTGGVAFPTQPVVTVQDQFGNTITGNSSSVTLAITGGTGTTGAALTCTTNPLPASSGVASFSGCKIDKAGSNYTLTATDGSLTSAVSSTFNIAVGPATKVVFTTQPSGSTGGIVFPTQPAITVEDAGGNTVTGNSSSVTLAISSGTGTSGAALTCTTNPLAASSGVASFAGCKIDKAGSGYTLSATDGALTSAISTAFDVSVGPATKLVFTQQPNSTTAGVAISPAVTVQVQDAGGNLTSSTASVTVAIGTNPGGGTLSGTTTVAAAGGVASFSDLSINKSGNGYTLTASSSGLTGATSGAFNISTAAASKLAFTTQPSSSTSSVAFPTQPVVTIQDQFGNTITGNSSSVTLAITSGTGTGGAALTCTTNPLAASSGVASFAGCKIDKAGSGYTLTATDGSLTSAISSAFDVSVGAATKLVYSQQPTSATAGVAISPAVTVQVQDAGGNLVSSSTADVSMAIGTNPGGGTLSGTTTVAAAGGVASFSDLSINKSGNGYTLTASSSGLTGATSSAFNISTAAASKLAFTTQPSSSTGGVAFPTQPVVTVQDQFGNTITGNSSSVALAITGGTGTTGAALTCTTNPLAASSGVASFSGCKIDKAGSNYTLTATDGSLTSAVSSTFNIAVGPATKVVFTTQPSSSTGGIAFPTQPVVTIEDAGGNTVTGNSSSVTLAISSGTGTSGAALTCTTNPLAASSGVASFAGCKIDKVGSGYTLTATDGALTTAISTAFDVSVGPASKLVYSQQPTSATAGVAISPAVTVQVQDAGGNLVSSSTANVSMAIGTNPGGGILTGTTPVMASGGVASFSDLSINKSGNGYTLTASSSGLTGATSGAFNITAAAASKLAFTTQPGSSTSGVAFPTQPVVTIQDQFGNTITGNSSSVTLAISSGTGTTGAALTCTTNPLAASSGVASFAGCNIDKAGSGYTLTASDGSLTSTISSAFNVSAGTASQFVVTPSTGTPAAASSFTVTLTAEDAGGNVDTTYSGTKTITWSGATTSPAGTAPTYPATSVAFSSGTSTTTLTATLFAAGANTLTASATSPAVIGSATVTVSAGAASHLAWTNVAVAAGTLSSPCSFSCTDTGIGANGTFTANVSVTDQWGNTVSNIGSGHTVTVSTPSSGGGSGGAFTAPTSGTSVTLTISASGAANSTVTFTFKAQNGSWTSDTFSASTAAGTVYTSANATVNK